MVKKKCKVCEEAEYKYKCPTCFIPYCSLGCFKNHKDIQCVKQVVPSEEKTMPDPVIRVERPCYVDDRSSVLQQSQLESIASSREIIDALKNEELQKLICNIDSSADAESELEKAMEVEGFHEFTDKILSTIS